MGTTGSGKTTGGKTGTSKLVAKKTATAPAAKRSANSGTAATPRKSGSEKALANTRALLETKLAHDRQAPAWHAFDAKARGKAPKAGYQSEEAKARAAELHEGESRLESIEGSLSTQDRRTQGKRDSR
jgi:hypothetical protein